MVGIGGPSAPHMFALDRVEDLGALAFSLHTLLCLVLLCHCYVMLVCDEQYLKFPQCFSAMFVVKICGYLNILFVDRCSA